MKNSLKVLFTLLLSLLLIAGCGNTQESATSGGNAADSKGKDAEGYPTKPITIYLPYSAGGTSDVMTRAIAPQLEKKLGQTVVVENKEGGSGSIMMQTILQAKPDGYTLGITSNGPSVITPHLNDVGYNVEDFKTVNQITSLPYVLIVPKDSKYNSLEEFFDDAKANPKKLKVAIPGATTSQAVILSIISKELGVELNIVPFDGGGETLNAVLGNNVDASLNLQTEVVSQIKEGAVKPLGITEKSSFIPEVKTFVEQGIMEDEVIGAYYGLVAHPDTPDDIVGKIDSAMKEILEDPEVKTQLDKIFLDIVYSNNSDFRTLINSYNDMVQSNLSK